MGDDYEIMDGVEVQPDTEDGTVASYEGMVDSGEALEPEEDIQEPGQEVPLDISAEAPAPDTTVSDTVSSDRVEEIVEAVLSDDRVTSLLDSFSYTMQTVQDTVTAVSEAEDRGEEEQDPVVVVSADELLDKLEARQAETAQAAQAAEAAQVMVKSAPSTVKSGEILVPGEEEVLPLEIIAQVIQALYEHFQEDDIDTLTEIKDAVTEIRTNVEPHPLLETPFEEYTVTEGLLLVALLWFVVLNPCIKMLKGGFSWLN